MEAIYFIVYRGEGFFIIYYKHIYIRGFYNYVYMRLSILLKGFNRNSTSKVGMDLVMCEYIFVFE